MARWRPEMGHMQHHSEIWATCQAVALLDVFNLTTLFPIVVQAFSEAIAIVETFLGSIYKPSKIPTGFYGFFLVPFLVRSSNASHLPADKKTLVGLAWLCHMGMIMFQHVPAPFHYQNIWSWLLTQEQRLTSIATCYAMDQSSLLEGTLIDPISPHAGNNFGILDWTFWFWTTVSHCHAVPEGEIGKNVRNKRHQTEHQPKPQYNPIQSQHCDEHQLKRSDMQIPANGIRMKNNTTAYHWQRPSAKLKCPLLRALIPAAFGHIGFVAGKCLCCFLNWWFYGIHGTVMQTYIYIYLYMQTFWQQTIANPASAMPKGLHITFIKISGLKESPRVQDSRTCWKTSGEEKHGTTNDPGRS